MENAMVGRKTSHDLETEVERIFPTRFASGTAVAPFASSARTTLMSSFSRGMSAASAAASDP
jgi:hypothetical protein